jgi:hypothetical protein
VACSVTGWGIQALTSAPSLNPPTNAEPVIDTDPSDDDDDNDNVLAPILQLQNQHIDGNQGEKKRKKGSKKTQLESLMDALINAKARGLNCRCKPILAYFASDRPVGTYIIHMSNQLF